MTLAALALTLGSSIGWSGFDAIRKHLAVRVPAVPLTTAVIGIQVIPFLAWFFAQGPQHLDTGYLALGAICLVLNVAANLLFVRSLALAPLSQTIPFLSLTPVLTLIAAIPLVGEWPSVTQGAGIGLVVGGAVALALLASASGSGPAWPRARSGYVAMMIVALLWSIAGPLDKVALRHAPPSLHALTQTAGVGLVLLFFTYARREMGSLRALGRERWRALAAAMLLSAAGLGLQLLAIRQTLVSLVETTKRAVGMAGSVVNGRLLFGERVSTGSAIAIAAMGAGVALALL